MNDADFMRTVGWCLWGAVCIAMAVASFPAPFWWAWLLAIAGGVVVMIPLPLGDDE